jgi:hypothetical protein
MFLLLFLCYCCCFTDVVAAVYFTFGASFIDNVSFAVVAVMLLTLSSLFFENCSPG